MNGIFTVDAQGRDVRLATTYNSFVFNDPTADDNDYAEITDILPQSNFDAITDPNQQKDGLEAYGAKKVARTFVVRGVMRAPSIPRLYDRIEAMAVALDPALASYSNPSVEGFLPWDFSVPTENLTTYPNGLIPSRYYARGLKPPDPPDSRLIGTSVPFEFSMLCRDPRRYLQTTSSLSGGGTAANTKADYPSWPIITITMSGAGSATYQIANTTLAGSPTIWLNLSGRSASDIVVVDSERQSVTVNGTVNDGLVGSATSWWFLQAGNNTITITNGTNASTSTLWRPAFAL